MSDYGHEKIYWENNKMFLKHKIKIFIDLLIVEKKNELDLSDIDCLIKKQRSNINRILKRKLKFDITFKPLEWLDNEIEHLSVGLERTAHAV
jgi:hypothetical protein